MEQADRRDGDVMDDYEEKFAEALPELKRVARVLQSLYPDDPPDTEATLLHALRSCNILVLDNLGLPVQPRIAYSRYGGKLDAIGKSVAILEEALRLGRMLLVNGT